MDKETVDNNVEIGKKIKKWRKLKDITQSELGAKINKTLSSVQKYEKGDVTIPIDVLNNIAIALNIGIDKLISQKGAYSNKIDDFNEYQYDAFIKLFLSLGYTIEEIPIYLGKNSEGYPDDNWETALILKRDKKILQLNLDDVNILFDDIEKYIDFSIYKKENSQEFKNENIEDIVENNIDEYYTDEYIEKIKEKIGYYGDEYIKPLNTAEKIVWERWKENNKVAEKK